MCVLLEGMRIAFQANFYGFLAFVLFFQRVEALLAVTVGAKFTVRKAVTVQFQALGLRAVAVLPSNACVQKKEENVELCIDCTESTGSSTGRDTR